MTIKNIAEKVAGVLPIGSGIKYNINQFEKPIEERDSGIRYIGKILGHATYTAVFGAYVLIGSVGGIWTPQQYKQAFEKVKARNEQNKIEIAQTEEYKQKLFGENGYADKDGEKGISPSERFEVYKRAGLEDKIIFPELSVKDLEKAVKSYEADNQE